MNEKIKPTMQTLVGIITPCDWDENGDVCRVSLSATDDEEYVIENSDRFIDLVQTSVRATGLVTFGKKTHRMINIKKYHELDHNALFELMYPEHSRAITSPGSDRLETKQSNDNAAMDQVRGRY
jgi:hypothetical protein